MQQTSGSEHVLHILERREVFDVSVQQALPPALITSAAVAAHVV